MHRLQHVAVLFVAMLLVSEIIHGQSLGRGPCPEGFQQAGRLYAEASGGVGREAKVTPETIKSLALPENYVLDTSYQQGSVTPSGGNEASSDMTASMIPSGFHLIPSGTESGGCQGWAVSNPKSLILKRRGNTIVQEGIQMNMYCHSGSGFSCMDGRGCNVTVDVCVKPAS